MLFNCVAVKSRVVPAVDKPNGRVISTDIRHLSFDKILITPKLIAMPESTFDVINFEMERDKSIVLGELLNAKSDDFNKVSLSRSVLSLTSSPDHL